MTAKTYAEMQSAAGDPQLAARPPLNFAVLRNVVVEPIEPYLIHYGAQIGFRTVTRYGEYDTLFQEAVGSTPDLLNDQADCVLVWLKLENLSWSLARGFSGLSADQRQAELERIRHYITGVAGGIRRQTRAMILWFGFEMPVYPALGIAGSQLGAIGGLNQFIRETLQEQGNAYLIDSNLLLARVGRDRFYDARYWHLGRAPYGREALHQMAFEAFKYVRALKGRSRKCLVLDCDNVLWGGIIGEDSLAEIRLGKTHPGSAYWEFQNEVLDLYHRGVLLAVCSKNNEADVWDVFERHPDMVLRREHIAAARINWQDKAVNLREIAAELNLGLDSLVYVDDSEFEVHLVREMVPEVEVIHLPKDQAVESRDRLAACGWFETLNLSAEDARRGALYAAEAQREQLRTGSADLESYYTSLEMTLGIKFADDFSIPRIAQLTQKTNQFNLTTRRYSDLDIRQFSASDTADVISLRLTDRFGDAGIVGVAILTYESGTATIDTLLLSCRVLGRRVEDALLSQCIRLAAWRNCQTVKGVYRETAKNRQVRDFYRRHGFHPRDGGEEFLLNLTGWQPAETGVFKRIDSEIESVET